MAKKEEKDLFASLIEEHKDNLYNHIQDAAVEISTGSLGLDREITIRSGGVVRLAGPTGGGKTSQAFLLAKNSMEQINGKHNTSVYKGSKTLYIKAEARLGLELQSRTGLKFVFNAADWAVGTVYVLESNVYETVATIIEQSLQMFYKQGIQLNIIVDSMDGLILKDDLENKGYGANQKVAGAALLTKIMFKRLGLPINKYGCLFIVMSQVSAAIKLDPYSKEPPRVVAGAGGNALNHQCDYILEYMPKYTSDYICENPDEKPSAKNKILGHWCRIKIAKSGKETDGVTVEIPIKHNRIGNAVWLEKEIVDYLLGNGLIEKKGAWMKINAEVIMSLKNNLGLDIPEQFQGLNSVYEFFEANKAAAEHLAKRFKN